MSALSEALERQLRKIMPLPPVAPASVSTYVLQAFDIQMFYKKGTSDKVYQVQIVDMNNGVDKHFEVHFQYGRRGKTLIRGTKTSYPVTFQEATDIYHKLVHEKRSKGYRGV